MAVDSTAVDKYIQQIVSQLSGTKKTDYGVLGSGVSALGTLLNGNKVSDAYGASAADAESQANSLRTQMDNMPTLASMYGQDSPYALEMQKRLAAKDAAAGRNSQYGPRLQALQADLASKGSQYAQQQAAMAQAYGSARAAANTARTNAVTGQSQVQGQQLASLFDLGQKSGAVPWLNDKIAGGLGNMFGSGTGYENTAVQQPMDQSVYAGRGGNDYSGYTTGSDDNFLGYDGAVNQPFNESVYGGGGDYSGYTTGSDQNYQGYNAPSGTDLYDEY